MNYEWQWDFVWDILPQLVTKGAVLTIKLTTMSVLIGTAIGLVIALLRLSGFKPFKWFAVAYTDFFRGTPLLVQIMIVQYALPIVFGYVPNLWVNAVAALSVNSGAYVAEIFRAGIQSIDKGQMEAARSLGMSRAQSMRYVILPQAFKISIPPLGNEFIALLKDSSLVSIIGFQELMNTGKLIVGRQPRVLETYLTVAVLYLIMTMSISQLVAYAERRLHTGDSH
ncbi:MAG: amino acid ABC transporter permease [Dehalobacterium sp.]|jgi:glutamine transport system permease protein